MTGLLDLTAELVGVSSVSHDEQRIAGLVEERLRRDRGLEVSRIGNNVVARTTRDLPTRIVLAGHLDTVPPAGNAGVRVEGTTLFGCGSADMKGGVAVLLDLASSASSWAYDTTYVFYACEEVSREHSGLLEIERAAPELLDGDAAVLAEPTGGSVEAGCQGVLRAGVTVTGVRAHVARPWTGENAVHRLGPLLERLAAFEERRPVLDGCTYRETLQAVRVAGGVANNVVPDRVRLTLSHRFAPDRDAELAFASLVMFLESVIDRARGDLVELEDSSPSARPALSHPVLGALLAASGAPPRAKLGWTDVAFFAERGIPAANFGPGDPLLAHTAGEHVSAAELEHAREVLAGLLER